MPIVSELLLMADKVNVKPCCIERNCLSRNLIKTGLSFLFYLEK